MAAADNADSGDSQLAADKESIALEELMVEVKKDDTLCALGLERDEAVKYVRARKNDVQRSLQLVKNHMSNRHRYRLDRLNPNEGQLHTELMSGKFTILNSRDSRKAQLLLFTMKNHLPSAADNFTVLQSVVLQLDTAMTSAETQRNGVVLLVDMLGSGFANFDRKMSYSLLNLLQDGYPARLKQVYVIDAPWWLKTVMAVVLPFLKKKTQERIISTSRLGLARKFAHGSLPEQLGGEFRHDHSSWIQTCIKYYQQQQRKQPSGEVDNAVTVATVDSHHVGSTSTLSLEKEAISAIATPNKDNQPPPPPRRSSSTKKSEAQRSPDKPPKRQHGVVPVEDAMTPPLPDKSDKDWNEAPPLPPKDLDVYSDDDHAMSIQGLEAFIRERGQQGLRADYTSFQYEKPAGNFDMSSHPANAAKNRYGDVLCLEHSRVRLMVVDEDDFSDYINANFVDSYKQKNAYIFTQGPLHSTYADFWRMVWEQESQIIVMTTKLWERSRMKCGQYWPELNETVEHGKLAITNREERAEADYTVRVFNLQKGDESHIVTQYQFTGWPDFGVPPSAQSLLQFLEDIHRLQAQHSKDSVSTTGDRIPPIVMHCSAGIGRTGTLGAIDIALQQLRSTGKVNIEGIVRKMRCQRAFSIQTAEQYEFCFRAILEASKSLPELDTQH